MLEPLAELLHATTEAAVAPAIVSLDVHGVDDVVRLLKLLDDGEAERLAGGFGGAITMLVTPVCTAWERGTLGPDATLVVIQPVVLDTELARARQTVRGHTWTPEPIMWRCPC